MLYVNIDYQQRTWPFLTTRDGTSLTLASGEEADLNLPDGFTDPFLKPVVTKTPEARKPKVEPKEDPAPAEAAADAPSKEL